jgi:formylglycine-generating enzyme required for sulfatase activity
MEAGRTEDEGKRRIVEITNRFAIGRFAVTSGQFSEFIKRADYKMPKTMQTYENRKLETRERGWNNPGFPNGIKEQTEKHPVVGVRWEDAIAFTDWLWLSRTLSQTYRLPSEAEWEYAARAGTDTAYWCGGEIASLYNKANFDRLEYGGTVSVDEYVPNPWGLYQVHGNVWEWCDNRYADVVVLKDRPQQYSDISAQSMRGGSWRSEGRHCRSANRSRSSNHTNSIGFRVVRDIDQ